MAVVVLAIGIGAWQLLDRDGSVSEVHVTGPADVSTGPVLEWAEYDPGLADAVSMGFLEPLGDGRVLLRTFDHADGPGSGFRFLATENGVDWSELPIPKGLWPPRYDLSGDRWLVAGYDFNGEPLSANLGTENSDSRVLSGYRVFFSDDQGASWTESEFDFSSSSIQVPLTYDPIPYFVSAALTSGDHMVIVLQGDEADAGVPPDPGSGVSSGSEEGTRQKPKARVFASDGGAFEQVAEYDGSVYSVVLGGSVSTPAGFSLQLYVESGTDPETARPFTLTSPNGRIWSKKEGASSLLPTALGPDGSLWRMVWLGTRYGLHRFDREGILTTRVAFDNMLPFQMFAGPSGLAVNAATLPGSDLFILPDQRIVKEGFELRLNEPEGGFTLWDLATGTEVYKCGRKAFWARGLFPAEGDCQFEYPEDDDAGMDAEVLIFEDMRTGAELVSFTRGELLPTFPLWVITGLAVDSPEEEEYWLGWSADGIKWGWQSPADAFGIDPFEASEALVWLAVGDGYALARVEQIDDFPPDFQSIRWFIAQVP